MKWRFWKKETMRVAPVFESTNKVAQDELLKENLNGAMGDIVEQWREYDPEFVAYVERFGGYEKSTSNHPAPAQASHTTAYANGKHLTKWSVVVK